MTRLTNHWLIVTPAITLAFLSFGAHPTFAQHDGVTAPFREISLAAAEPGLLVSLDIQEGDKIDADSIVARLDHEVLNASLAVAKQQMESVGQLNSAEAELRLRNNRWEKLTILRKKQHASDEEVSLALTERDVAKARLLAAKESIQVKRLEHLKIKASLDRRFIKVPFTGVVTDINKEIGEFVSASDPSVMTVVQLNPLLAIFSLPPARASELTRGDRVKIQFGNSTDRTESGGTVLFISPVINAESNEIRVKVEIPNPDYALHSGAQCTLLDGKQQQARVGLRPTSFGTRTESTGNGTIRITPIPR